jgi:hypothetical protein
MFNTAGGGPFAIFNSGGYLGLGPCDGSGTPTAFFQWIDGSGNVSMTRNLTINGQFHSAGAVTCPTVLATGAAAYLGFEDRFAAGQQWLWYAQEGTAALYFGGDRIQVSSTGDLIVIEDVTVGRNLQVNGSAAVSGPLHVVGYATFDNGANISNVSLSGPVYASGDITSGGAFHAAPGSTSSFAALTASTGNFSGDVTTSGAFHAAAGTTSTFGVVSATGDMTSGGALHAGSGSTSTFANLSATGTLGVTGNTTINGALQVGSGRCIGGWEIDGKLYCLGGVQGDAAGNLFFDCHILPEIDNRYVCGGGSYAYYWNNVGAYSFYTASDRRLKQDIGPVPDDCLTLVKAIEPQRFRIIGSPPELDRVHWGFIAQQVGEAMTAAGQEFGGRIISPQTGRESLSYNDLLALLWRAVQQLADNAVQGLPV